MIARDAVSLLYSLPSTWGGGADQQRRLPSSCCLTPSRPIPRTMNITNCVRSPGTPSQQTSSYKTPRLVC